MSITTRIGQAQKRFVDSQGGWCIAGDRARGPSFDVGLEAWAIGTIGFSIAVTPLAQLEITNSSTPNAGQIFFEGAYLPNWPRLYRIDLHTIQLTGGIGAGLAPEVPTTVNMTWELWSKAWGTPILRHRQNGAPPARDNQHNYVAGDPTGFLGLGLGGSVGASGLAITLQGGGDVKLYQFGSNLVQLGRDIREGRIGAAAMRSLGMLFGRGHLQYHFSGILAGIAGNASLGTGLSQLISGEVAVSAFAMWISRLHLFIHHPNDSEDMWRYVYTRHIKPDLTYSAPYKVQYHDENVGIWDQSFLQR